MWFLVFVLGLPLSAQVPLPDLDKQLDVIRDNTQGLETVGIIYNPEEVAIDGARVRVKTIAVPATNGPLLIKNARSIVGRVEAIYLLEGRSVTTPKFASFVVKLASKKGVRVFTNDPKLMDLEGIQVLSSSTSGAYVIN